MFSYVSLIICELPPPHTFIDIWISSVDTRLFMTCAQPVHVCVWILIHTGHSERNVHYIHLYYECTADITGPQRPVCTFEAILAVKDKQGETEQGTAQTKLWFLVWSKQNILSSVGQHKLHFLLELKGWLRLLSHLNHVPLGNTTWIPFAIKEGLIATPSSKQ